MLTSFPWIDEISSLYDRIFSFDDPNKSWAHDDFMLRVDGQLFTKISEIGASLPLPEFVSFCERVKQHNGRHLLCDKDYGHMGLGMLGLGAVFEPLVKQLAKDDQTEAKLEVVHRVMTGRRIKIESNLSNP